MLLDGKRPLVMGILNVTPDSFSDGGEFVESTRALDHAFAMIEAGADIIDIGGESTRPGAAPVSIEEECQRVLPIVEALKKETTIPISVDTRNVEVMRHAIELGVELINDVNSLQSEGAIDLVAKTKVSVCLYHCQGTPQTMQHAPYYENVVQEVSAFFEKRLAACIAGGIAQTNIILDPGFGFGKTLEHNLSLLRHFGQFKSLNCSLLAGLSRKSMFQHLLNLPVSERLPASLAAAVVAYQNGANILRVHDVKATKEALAVAHAVISHKESE